jgi:TolB-like protein
MFSAFRKISKRPHSTLVISLFTIFILGGCAAESVTHPGLNRGLLEQENIQKVAVLPFESPMDDLQAGVHISSLFENYLIQSGLYQVAERSSVERILKDKAFMRSPEMDPSTLHQIREKLGIDGVILGSVSQYNRANLGFTARLVSTKSGMVLWSISQTGGRVVRPLSQVADETVQAAVRDLQAKIR